MLSRLSLKKCATSRFGCGCSSKCIFRKNSALTSPQRRLFLHDYLAQNISSSPCLPEATSFSHFCHHYTRTHQGDYWLEKPFPESKPSTKKSSLSSDRLLALQSRNISSRSIQVRHISNPSIELKTDKDGVRFSFGSSAVNGGPQRKVKKAGKKVQMSRKAKLNELKFYRLKAKKKMNSPNPEVRIRYKLEKAIEKYRYEQSLEHTSQFIERLEKELQDYHEHLVRYKNKEENMPPSSTIDT